MCASTCQRRGDLTGKRIYIASDSQAALKALTSFTITSRLVSGCLDQLKKLATRCRLTLLWVPGHLGIMGNEVANELARKASEQPFIGPEPFCGLGINNFKMDLKNWDEKEKKS